VVENVEPGDEAELPSSAPRISSGSATTPTLPKRSSISEMDAGGGVMRIPRHVG
jgi:hypothetical protein